MSAHAKKCAMQQEKEIERHAEKLKKSRKPTEKESQNIIRLSEIPNERSL